MENKSLNILRKVNGGQSSNKYRPLMRDFVRSSCTNPIPLKNQKDMYDSSTFDVYVPCGECDNCRNSKANQLFSRLYIAAKELQNAYFITLTYSSYDRPDDIPYQHLDSIWHYDNYNKKHRYCWRPCLIQYSHAQEFIHKLRTYLQREYGRVVELGYYIGSEYGFDFGAPHYHLIIFSKDKIPTELFTKSWSIDNRPCGRMQVDDLFENGTMFGIADNAKKCFKYCAKYAGKGNPYDFNSMRVRYAYDYFFNQKSNTECEFNYSDKVYPISLQKISQSQLDNLVLKINGKVNQLERAESLRDKYYVSNITREKSKFTYWSEKANKYYDELRCLNIEYNKNKRVCYVSKENYAIDEGSLRYGVPEKVFNFYNENRLCRYYRRCKSLGITSPQVDETRMYYKSRQEFVPILFKEFCSIYRQCGHISTGSVFKTIYDESYSERMAKGNKRMPKAVICSTSLTALQGNGKMSLQLPQYFKYLATKEQLPFSLYCKSIKQSTCFHKLTYKNHFEYWMDLYNAAITYDGPLRINKYVELNWSHISRHGEPPIRAIRGYIQLVGPYRYGNHINTLSIKSTDIFDSYIHKSSVVDSSVDDITFSSLYNRDEGEYYRLVIGRTEDGLTDVKFAVYYYDKELKSVVFDRYETFRHIYNIVQEQFDNYQGEWQEKRAYIDGNTEFYDVIKYGENINELNIDKYSEIHDSLENPISYKERLSIDSIMELTKEYKFQVRLNNNDWSNFHRDKEFEHQIKNKVC